MKKPDSLEVARYAALRRGHVLHDALVDWHPVEVQRTRREIRTEILQATEHSFDVLEIVLRCIVGGVI